MESSNEDINALCKNCSNLLPHSLFKNEKKGRWATYPDFPEIKASANKGCALCPLYLEALEEMYDEEGRPLDPEYDWVVRYENDPWPRPNWNRVVGISNPLFPRRPKYRTDHVVSFIQPAPPRSDRGQMLGMMRFDLWADAGSWLTRGAGDAAALHGELPLRLPEKDTLSDRNLRRIHGWLENCVAEHACCRTQKLPRLPTRVIDVGSSTGRSPRLIETDRRPAQYLALSHCWGTQTASGGNVRLLSSNLQDLTTEIPMGSISKNFQDAIEVVRKLEFKYLWIDALCIIQDSKSDWENESAKMNDVYECSYLTIVATAAATSDAGFLDRARLSAVTLPYRDDVDPTIDGKFLVTRTVTGRDPWNPVDKAAWNTRGWTYQERLLSRRFLHFTSSVLFWECRAIDCSEINVERRKLSSRPCWILDHPDDGQAAVAQSTIHSKYDRWYIVLCQFTARRLTYTSDLLPAVSGLAAIFQRSFAAGDNYIAGLWYQDFAQGLLWLVNDSSTTSKAILDYWAPSWSWASIAGTVLWPTRTIARHQRDDFTIELLENYLRVAQENPMGTVLGGHIHMRGRLRLLSCVTKPIEWGAFLRFRYDLWCGDELVGNGQFDADQDDIAEEVWLLQMKLQQDGDCVFPYHPTALMLERVPGSWLKFVRLGCAVLDNEQLDFFDVCEPQNFDFY